MLAKGLVNGPRPRHHNHIILRYFIGASAGSRIITGLSSVDRRLTGFH